MKNILLLIPLLFVGCSLKNNVQNFTKCYIKQIPAPFWICYQDIFTDIGKIYTPKLDRLKQEEAYNIALSNLYNKLLQKSISFANKCNTKIDEKFKKELKNFVLINGIEEDYWYDSHNKMIFVKVNINKKEFKKFLFSKFSHLDKKTLEQNFDEVF